MLHEKIICFNVPMQNAFFFLQRLNFSFPSNVKRVTGLLISADRTGIGTQNVFFTSLQANSDTELVFSGDVLVPDLATFNGHFNFIDVDIEPKANSVWTGYAVHKSCASNYNAKYYFRVEEEV